MIGYPIELLIIFIFQSNKCYENAITFGILGVLVIIFDCLLLFFPNKYFFSQYNFIGYKSKEKDEFINFENSGQVSFFENQEHDNIKNNEIGFLKIILNNKIYIFSIATDICYLFFVIAFLVSLNKLNFDDCFEFLDQLYISSSLFTKDHIYIRLGYCYIIYGGICLLYVGGYENKNSSILFSIYAIILYYIVLFFQAYKILLFALIFPLLLLTINKCFIVNCIPNKYKGSGVALSLFLRNIIQILKPFLKFFYNSEGLNKVIILYILVMILVFFLHFIDIEIIKMEIK